MKNYNSTRRKCVKGPRRNDYCTGTDLLRRMKGSGVKKRINHARYIGQFLNGLGNRILSVLNVCLKCEKGADKGHSSRDDHWEGDVIAFEGSWRRVGCARARGVSTSGGSRTR